MSDEVSTSPAPTTTLTVKDPMALAAVRAEYWASGNLKNSCARAGVPYDTGKYWNKKGWLDQENDEITMALARTITPETMIAMAQNAAGLVIEAQKQVGKTIKQANARDASTIARQQFDIHQLATGQATARVEFMSADDLIREVEKLRLDEGFIEGEVVEES
jgi:hypothetical protein